MPCLHFSPSKNMSSYNYRLKLNSFKEMGVVNFEALIQVFKNLALGIATHVLMLLNKMVWWKVIIDKQQRLDWCCLLQRHYHCHSGLMFYFSSLSNECFAYQIPRWHITCGEIIQLETRLQFSQSFQVFMLPSHMNLLEKWVQKMHRKINLGEKKSFKFFQKQNLGCDI